MIVGGGNVGAGLARQLEGRYSVKLIERNPERAEVLSEMLEKPLSFVVTPPSKVTTGRTYRADRCLYCRHQR